MTRRTFAAALLGASALLTGCGATYDVAVRNDGQRTIAAELVHDPLLATPLVVDAATIRPGDTAQLFAEGLDPFDPVTVRVRVSGDSQGLDESIDAPSGTSTVVVESGGVESWTGLRLRTEPGSR